VHAERDQLVRVVGRQALRAQVADELLRDVEDAERQQLVGIQVAQVCGISSAVAYSTVTSWIAMANCLFASMPSKPMARMSLTNFAVGREAEEPRAWPWSR
jgi:hypothetical protein